MRHYHPYFKEGFSLIELIFVIVILGIVSSIGAEIIANVYEQYIVQRAQHRASLKTELATLQIANRLKYAIGGTIVRIKSDGTTESIESPLSQNSNSYIGIQWVSYDVDSFEALNNATQRQPGWSGFCDLDESNKTVIKTPGSTLSLTNNIIKHLSGDTKTIKNAVIYFPYSSEEHNISSISGEDLIYLTDVASRTLVEQYKLAWSSYALKVEGGDLYLYYNFSPFVSETLGSHKSLLLKNISTFNFKGSPNGIRFKLCAQEEIGESFKITSCKEKVAF